MRKSGQDSTIAVLDNVAEIPDLVKCVKACPKGFLKCAFRGAIYYSPELNALGADFSHERAGFDFFRRDFGRPNWTSIRGQCREGIVRNIWVERRNQQGPLFAAEELDSYLPYLKGVFQKFADIVTPAFGRSYMIGLEDRSRGYKFHTDPDLLIATFGLDKESSPTIWKDRWGFKHSGDNGALMFNFPTLRHSSVDMADRPVISAVKPWGC